MIDKKVLILTAAMVPMLGLADVGATGHGGAQHNGVANQHMQQQNQVVVTIDGKEFSQYDAMCNVIKIDQNTFSLNSKFDKKNCIDTIGNFLRRHHPREAAELGMYANILNDPYPFSSSSHDNLEETWCEFLMSRAPEVALFLNLYTPANLGKIMNKGGFYAFYSNCYEGLTFREFLILTASIGNVNIWQAICGDNLNYPVSKKFLYLALPQVEILDEADNSNLLLKEFFCYFKPLVAEKMGLFTEELLDREIHPLIVAQNSSPTQPSLEGLSLREYLYWGKCIAVEAVPLPEDFLDKPLPQQIVQQEPDKYIGLNWRSFLYKFKNTIVRKLNLEPGFAVYKENFKLEFCDYMRFYRKEDAVKYGLYNRNVFSQKLPSSITEIDGNQILRGWTWGDYYPFRGMTLGDPRGIWFFMKTKINKDFKDEF